jgi:hypothetical protein
LLPLGLGDFSSTRDRVLARSSAAPSSVLATFPVPPRPMCVAPWLSRRMTL